MVYTSGGGSLQLWMPEGRRDRGVDEPWENTDFILDSHLQSGVGWSQSLVQSISMLQPNTYVRKYTATAIEQLKCTSRQLTC